MIRLRRGFHGDKRWQWRVKLKGFPTRSGTCPTKECARECARQAEFAIKGGGVLSRLTVDEVIDRYIELHLPTIPDSSKLYLRHLTWWGQELGQCQLGI